MVPPKPSVLKLSLKTIPTKLPNLPSKEVLNTPNKSYQFTPRLPASPTPSNKFVDEMRTLAQKIVQQGASLWALSQEEGSGRCKKDSFVSFFLLVLIFFKK